MGQKRYIIEPGYVKSQHDGEVHYITASQLAQLYGVNLNAPNVIVRNHMKPEQARGFRTQIGDVLLTPRYDGDYTLPD